VILPVEDQATVERAMAAPRAVIYKHSPRCGVCVASDQEIRHFVAGPCDVPVFWIDVVTHRQLSQRVAEHLGVTHESPQVILVERGRAIWHASHWEVRASDLEEQVTRLSTR
jgi:bacillithiol system protein YtxJ